MTEFNKEDIIALAKKLNEILREYDGAWHDDKAEELCERILGSDYEPREWDSWLDYREIINSKEELK